MNEEEKEAIEMFEFCSRYNCVLDGKRTKIILNLIKQLQKENEELEEINNELEAEKNEAIRRYNFEAIPIQKVKDKMEYLDNQQKQWLEDRELKENDSEIIFARDILKELLEKE